MRYFYPPATRDAYKWQLLLINKGDISVEDYMREFLRLSRYGANVIRDEHKGVYLFVTGFGPSYIGIQIEDQRLESVIEEARQLERRYIRRGIIPDPYVSSIIRTEVAQCVQ